jgi:DNA polymerase III delta subunit
MIYLVHGEDVPKTRALIVNQQKKLKVETKTELEINDTTPQTLESSIMSRSLFGDAPFILLDVTKAGRKKMDEYIEVLKKTSKDTTVIIVAYKDLPKTNAFIKSQNALKLKIIKNEKIPSSNVFRFLDALADKSRKRTYRELSKLIKEDQDEMYLIAMVQYMFRNLAYGIFKSPQFNKINPYVKNKTKAQLKNFTQPEIKNLYNEIYNIDKNTKTGVMDPSNGLTLAVEKVLNS